MTYIHQARKLRRFASGALIFSAFALFSACGGDKKESLLLVDAPLPAYAASASTMEVYVAVGGVQVAYHSLDAKANAAGKYGFYLPATASGDASVSILLKDLAGCLLATGSGPTVAVSPSKTSGPIIVTFAPSTAGCGPDAAVPDASGVDVGDAGVVDAVGAETQTEAGPAVLDGPLADVARTDAQLPDVALDVPANTEVSTDVPSYDVPQLPEVGIDGNATGIDVSPDVAPTPLNVLRNCSEYTHTVTFSSGTVGDWAVLKVLFTPDGKNLISFGEDGRVKVWDVTATGLKPQVNDLLFSGDGELSGAVRSDGKYLAVGERYGKVTIYDLPASLESGAASSKWVLPSTSLAKEPRRAYPLQFTSDGTHLAVVYSGKSSSDPNTLAVWDLASQVIVRSVAFDYDEWPITMMPGSSFDSMWVASTIPTSADGGTASLVTLMDIALASPVKTQSIVSGSVGALAFSPDGKTLAVGKDSNEVGLWDISDKTKLVAPLSPLIPSSTGFYTGVYSFAFTSDSSHLAVATEGGSVPAVKLASLAQKKVVTKDTLYTAITVAFAPGNLALAVGEMNKGVVLYCTP